MRDAQENIYTCGEVTIFVRYHVLLSFGCGILAHFAVRTHNPK